MNSEQTLCLVDIFDFGAEHCVERIEIKQMLTSGGFQTVAAIDVLGNMSSGMFHGVFKVCSTGQRSQSKDEALP